MGQIIGWLLSLSLAFFIGISVGNHNSDAPSDSELQQKVQDHMDVIIDEAAGIVDDVAEEARKDERVREAEEFVDDVKDIAQNTADDIDAHFGDKDEAEGEAEPDAEEAENEAKAAEETEAAEEEAAEEAAAEPEEAEQATEG